MALVRQDSLWGGTSQPLGLVEQFPNVPLELFRALWDNGPSFSTRIHANFQTEIDLARRAVNQERA